MKLLTSWIAFNNDFKDGKASEEGPTYGFHKNFYKHDKHLILYAAESDDTRVAYLVSLLNHDFSDHQIETKCMHVADVINLEDILLKVKRLLLDYKAHEIDIFFSPGTSIMQLSWYICNATLTEIKTRLIQTWMKKGKAKMSYIMLEPTSVPITLLAHQHEQKKRGLAQDEDYEITESLQPIYKNARKVAEADGITTLIIGETGTGKEHLARYIHEHSIRKDKPYYIVNCSAIGDQLLESQLFGHAKGSFTSAEKDSKGIFEMADGGTVFLDEIGDISPLMQQSLLRVLQEGEIRPIGKKSVKVDVRIIAATHKDLLKMCSEESFRWDLYYRLNVAELRVPSLQERGKKELKQLIDFFIKHQQKQLKKKKSIQLSDETKEALISYHYPGNVRELENLITRLYVFAEDGETIEANALPSPVSKAQLENSLSWETVEKQHIEKVLHIHKGNQRQTSIAIGWSINTLKSKMKKYGLHEEIQKIH